MHSVHGQKQKQTIVKKQIAAKGEKKEKGNEKKNIVPSSP
jgi:hypothetical protein